MSTHANGAKVVQHTPWYERPHNQVGPGCIALYRDYENRLCATKPNSTDDPYVIYLPNTDLLSGKDIESNTNIYTLVSIVNRALYTIEFKSYGMHTAQQPSSSQIGKKTFLYDGPPDPEDFDKTVSYIQSRDNFFQFQLFEYTDSNGVTKKLWFQVNSN